jgi:CHAT domain-containing protein
MWEVPTDETTQQIMDFYGRWLGGGEETTRYGAFRAAQLEALRKARETHGSGHPFYWAGTIYVGDPGDLPAVPLAEVEAK